MDACTFKILLADRAGPWRDALTQALVDEGHAVKLAADLDAAYEALVASPAMSESFDVVVVGEEIDGQSGIDLVYRAWQSVSAQRDGEGAGPAQFVPNVALVTALHEDAELLALLRKRGVTLFLERRAPLAHSVALIGRLTYGRYRRAARYPVKWGVHLFCGQDQWRGTMVDISLSGGQVVLGRKESAASFASGMPLSLVLSHPMEEGQLSLKVTIRRVRQLKALFGSRTSLGISFEENEDHGSKVGELVELAKALSSVLYRSALDIR